VLRHVVKLHVIKLFELRMRYCKIEHSYQHSKLLLLSWLTQPHVSTTNSLSSGNYFF